MKQFIEIPNAKKQKIIKDQASLPVNIIVPVSSIIGMMSYSDESFYQILLFDREAENGVAAFYISEETYNNIAKTLLGE